MTSIWFEEVGQVNERGYGMVKAVGTGQEKGVCDDRL